MLRKAAWLFHLKDGKALLIARERSEIARTFILRFHDELVSSIPKSEVTRYVYSVSAWGGLLMSL